MSTEPRNTESGGRQFDLHKMPIGEVTEGFDDEIGYLERVTTTCHADAKRIFTEAWELSEPEEAGVKAIHMRFVTTDPDPVVVPELPCWLECEADHSDAVPFWVSGPHIEDDEYEATHA